MRPTREFHYLGKTHRIYRCVDCGNEQPWLENPKMDGSFAELHKYKDGSGFSILSMLSDPRIKWQGVKNENKNEVKENTRRKR